MERFPGTAQSTLGEAKAWLRVQAMGDGADCPCCTQFSKVYKRSLISAMALALIRMYRQSGLQWCDVTATKVSDGSGTLAKLAYWGLAENEERGVWRVTPLGEAFVHGRVTVHKHAHTYNSRVLKMSGPQITIRQALGHKFDYDELMSARADGL